MMVSNHYNNASNCQVIALTDDSGLLRRLWRSIWPGDEKRREAAREDPPELECAEVRELASEYLDEELQGGILATLRRHLAECDNCNAFINTLKRTIGMMRELPLAKAPDSVRRSILDATSKRQS